MSAGAVAQQVGERVDAAALDAAGGDDELAGDGGAAGGEAHGLDRRAEVAGHRRRPGDAEADVRGPERRELDALGGEDRRPGAVRAEARPGARRRAPAPSRTASTARGPSGVAKRAAPSCQPSQRQRGRSATPCASSRRDPGAQERRGLHRRGEDPPGASGEDLDAESGRPAADLGGAEAGEDRREPVGAGGIGGGEGSGGLVLGQVQPGLARHQELAPERRPRLGQDDAPPGRRQGLGGHQPGRAAADHQRIGRLGRLHRRR